MRRAAVLALAVVMPLLASACSDHPRTPVPGDAHGEQHLRQDCDNATWKEQNLGLWYSLCRKPVNL
ncbi:MAG TPA: hypothetical protein VME41_18450 [Stellaceae bacterium]|nr:hypothetical protein [Stellaceae bacterium]